MGAAVVESSFDVALWFLDRALNDNEYLQPQKLHRLMFLSQAYFAVAYNGRMLMPAVFIADDMGPIEPNVFRAFASQIPVIERKPLPEVASHFLDSVWRRFGQHSAEHLNKLVGGHAPYRDALLKGPRCEIPLKGMIDFYGRKASASPETTGAPPVSQVMRPRVMRSQSGQPVSVQKWMPPAKPSK